MSIQASSHKSHRSRQRILPAALLTLFALPMTPFEAGAVPNAGSANDICAPAADPCIVSSVFQVTGPLDFGSRKVLFVPGGRLLGSPDITLDAGAIELAIGSSSDATISSDGSQSGQVNLTAWRACSGDGARRCLVDSQCASVGVGTCTAGNTGTIVADGMISTSGSSPGSAQLDAAGDIHLLRRLNVNANVAGIDAGSASVESHQGSVFVDAPVTAESDVGTIDYEAGMGGQIEIGASADVSTSQPIRAWGDGRGGAVNIHAGHDVVLNSDIMVDAGAADYAAGGMATIDASNDLSLVDSIAGGDVTQEVSSDGGGGVTVYDGGYSTASDGGRQTFTAGRNLTFGPNAWVHSRGGPGAGGGYIYLYANGGDATIAGSILSEGTPGLAGLDGGENGPAGGKIYINTSGNLTLTKESVISTASPDGIGEVALWGSHQLTLAGLIDVRATDNGGPYSYGTPGIFHILPEGYGLPGDITISGKLMGGGAASAHENWSIDACRLHLTPTAVLDQSVNVANASASGLEISVGEHFIADHGSRIDTDPAAGTMTTILYRDAKKPPVLSGTITPPPLVDVDSGLEGCPVCGNGEIDEGESCDDGNTVSGDGCRADCQDEGCIAATPGFPATPLCDDGVACSEDTCNPTTHACEHKVSCDDGIACTVDSCEAGGCRHVPADTACDDHNDCTFDVCSAATGCVYADLSATSCEDGDFCTAPGTCQHGTCSAAPGNYTTSNKIKAKLKPGVSDDELKASFQLQADQLIADPATTGAVLVVGDALGRFVYQVELPAADWESRTSGPMTLSRFPTHAAASPAAAIGRVKIRRDTRLNLARFAVRLRGIDLGATAGQTQLSLSMLFGTTPGTSPCMTAHLVPCKATGGLVSCRD